MARQTALITASVIRWAREKSHYDLETAAKKIGVSSEKLRAWEAEESQPTMTQARKMSQVYRRPLAAFYLPQPPKDFPLLKDFRTVEGKPPQYSPPLVFLMRQIQERQFWLTEYLKEQGHELLKFIGSASRPSSPKSLAKSIIKAFWGNEKNYSQVVSSASDLLKEWLSQCEGKGIFISRTSNLNSHNVIAVEEARGFSISDKHAPFIFINSGDSKNAQLFTLLHELAHLWLGISGVSDHFPVSKKSPDEFLCNQTAAEILMPEEKIKAFPKLETDKEIDSFIKENHKRLHVSQLALLVRLKSFSKLNTQVFNKLKEQYIKEYKKYKKEQRDKMKKAKGGPDSNTLKIHANGESFTKIVVFSYKEGLISGREASNLLDMKLNRMEKIMSMIA